jgi:CRP-like cAMP-binding protein
MALFMDDIRTASIEAVEPTELLILDKDSVMEQYARTEFAFAMLRKLSKKIQDAHKVISRLEGEKKSLEMIYGKR